MDNKKIKKSMLCLFLLSLVLFGCETNKGKKMAFFHWKDTFKVTNFEKKCLSQLGTSDLFLRVFDLTLDSSKTNVIPSNFVTVSDTLSAFSIIPVIFIDKSTLANINIENVNALAIKTALKIKSMMNEKSIVFNKLMIDYNWDAAESNVYFNLLKCLEKALPNVEIIAALRYNQAVELRKYGVLPTKHNLVYFYNYLKIDANLSKNNMLEDSLAQIYADAIAAYPNSFSLALPIYSWALQIRADKVINTLPRRIKSDFENNDLFFVSNYSFLVSKDSNYKGIEFKKGDLIKVESAKYSQLSSVAAIVKKSIRSTKLKQIVFFDLDFLNFNQFDIDSIKLVNEQCF